MSADASGSQLLPAMLYEAFRAAGVTYFCGVPDSLLSPVGYYLADHAGQDHDIAANEGNAVALAIGAYAASKKVPLVYMQNSGLGNALNPLVSLADPLVMAIPMVLLVGWRGQPGHEDEPQHKKQGPITTSLLDALGITYQILSKDARQAKLQIGRAVHIAQELQQPVALVVEAGTIAPYDRPGGVQAYPLSREQAIQAVIQSLDERDAVIATTGKASRELFEYREKSGQGHRRDLLIVGGMGHASTIAAAIAQHKPGRRIYCIDGDGALLMHMGALPIIGSKRLKNFYHIIINNGAHESVGGQPTVGFMIDIPAIAQASGYAHVRRVTEATELTAALQAIRELDGPVLLEVRVNTLSRSELSRPTITPADNRAAFMSFLDEV